MRHQEKACIQPIVAVVLVFLLWSPFVAMLIHDSAGPGRLTCYCSNMERGHEMIFCCGCNQCTDSDDSVWWPEMVFSAFQAAFFFLSFSGSAEEFFQPRTHYVEVPVKPPTQY
jgi:hypothetical protein